MDKTRHRTQDIQLEMCLSQMPDIWVGDMMTSGLSAGDARTRNDIWHLECFETKAAHLCLLPAHFTVHTVQSTLSKFLLALPVAEDRGQH